MSADHTVEGLLAQSKKFRIPAHHFLGTCVPQTIMGCLEGEGQSAFQRILDKVRSESLDVQTVVSLLRLYQDSNPAVETALSDREPEAIEEKAER